MPETHCRSVRFKLRTVESVEFREIDGPAQSRCTTSVLCRAHCGFPLLTWPADQAAQDQLLPAGIHNQSATRDQPAPWRCQRRGRPGGSPPGTQVFRRDGSVMRDPTWGLSPPQAGGFLNRFVLVGHRIVPAGEARQNRTEPLAQFGRRIMLILRWQDCLLRQVGSSDRCFQ